ncbi:MAG: Ig-like domain-containing protein, partial [Bacteroidia bacterium]
TGNDGNLYYFSISQNSLYKIIYSNNNAPAITTQPANQTITQGQNVSFTVSASGATPLNYQWQKNAVDIPGANSATYSISNVQQSNAGQYRCVVSNTYGNATSNSATLTVTAFNAQPVATILTPANGTIYRAGDDINFSGDATDQEDGNLPASAFQWIIDFHHDQHIHPGPTITPGYKTGSFNVSTTGEMSANVYFRIKLIVTDSQGLTDTAYVDVHPKTSTITLTSQPSGLQLYLDGQPHTTPYSILAVSGMQRNIGANASQAMNGTAYTFDHWVSGGAPAQNFTVTDNNQTFTAVYNISTSGNNCTATGNITRDYWAGISGTSISSIPLGVTPTSTTLLNIFEGPTSVGDNYGSRIRGYICPPATGNYIFWIASDDNSELWLSTNDQPVNKRKIAFVSGYTSSRQWTKYRSQQSLAMYLNAGQKYYIEALHKEGTQGDNLAVGWQLPDGTLERPIPGSRLASFNGAPPIVNITSPANNTSYASPSNITITANASGNNISKVEFYEGNTKLGEDNTSPYVYTWMNVTTGSYIIKAVAIDNSGQSGVSPTITVNVTSCSTPVITPGGPTTLCSGSVVLNASTGQGYVYQWKKDGNDISGATAASYTASASGDYQVKVIHGSCISWSAPVKVTIQNGLSAHITPGGPTTFCNGGNVKLFANTCAGYTYQWKKNGAYVPGATASVFTVTTSGNYQVQVTQNGTSAWSALTYVTVNTCNTTEKTVPDEEVEPLENTTVSEKIAAPDSAASFRMKVFPNPTTGMFTISFNMASTEQEKVNVNMINMLGQQVYSKQFSGSGAIREIVELDQSLPTGIYTLQVMVGNKVENTSVFLSR